jgi:hypothetical protein
MDPTSDRLARTFRLAVLSPGVILIASAIRLLVIANYDPTTADSIAAASGVVGTLLGTLIPIVPQILPILVLVFIAFRKPLLTIFAAVGTALISPAYATLATASHRTTRQFINVKYALQQDNKQILRHLLEMCWRQDRAAIIFGATAVLILVMDKRKRIFGTLVSVGSKTDVAGKITVGVSALIFGVLMAALLIVILGAGFFFVTTIYRIPSNVSEISAIASKPWLPSEIITLKGGGKRVGYTLNDSNGWFVFLEEKSRTIEYVHSDDVLTRTLCRLSGEQRPSQPPLIKLINLPAPWLIYCSTPTG